MTRPWWNPIEPTRDRTLRWCWECAGALAAPLAAIALWVVVVAGVAAPLGAALARLDAGRPLLPAEVAGRNPCPVPAGALASAASRPEPGRCR
jgi:hypothetical protein